MPVALRTSGPVEMQILDPTKVQEMRITTHSDGYFSFAVVLWALFLHDIVDKNKIDMFMIG